MNHSTILKALHQAVIAKHMFTKDIEFSESVARDMQAAYELLFPWMTQQTTVTLLSASAAALVKTEVEIENDRFVVLASHLDYNSGNIIQ